MESVITPQSRKRTSHGPKGNRANKRKYGQDMKRGPTHEYLSNIEDMIQDNIYDDYKFPILIFNKFECLAIQSSLADLANLSGSNKKFITIFISEIAFNLSHLNLIWATLKLPSTGPDGPPTLKTEHTWSFKMFFQSVEESISYFLHCNFYARIACNVKYLSSDVFCISFLRMIQSRTVTA